MVFALAGLARDPGDVFFDLLDLVDDLRSGRFQVLGLAEELLGGAEFPFCHHDRTKLEKGGCLVFLIGQSFAEGLADIAFCLADIVLLHLQHTHLQEAGAFRLFHRHAEIQPFFHILFGPCEILFHHGEIALERKVHRADRFVEQVREPDGSQHFFSLFHIAAFHMFLDQAQRPEKEIAKQHYRRDQVADEGGPEPGIYIGRDADGQESDGYRETVSDDEGIEFAHFVFDF